MCTVQKWHTSSRRISLRRANCLAKINHMLAAGLHCWRRHTCTDHRSRWPSVSCTRRPVRPATCHPSTWRPAESTRLPPTSTCVPDQPIGLTRNPATDIGSPLTWTPHTAHRQRSMASTDRPTPRSRSMSTARPPIPSVTTLRASLRSRALLRPGALLRAGIRLCAGICAEAAAARALPRAGTMRRRLWQVGLLRLKHAGWVERLVRRSSASEGGSDTHRPCAHGIDGSRFRSTHPTRCHRSSASRVKRFVTTASSTI